MINLLAKRDFVLYKNKTYEVKENRVSEDEWKTFRVMLEDYAKSFLGKYYPTVPIDFEFHVACWWMDETETLCSHCYYGLGIAQEVPNER